MILTPVESTTLTGLAYDMANGFLYLEFRDQAIYRYSDVPACVYRELLNAESKGLYFNRAIRGRYPYARLPRFADGIPIGPAKPASLS